jgi:hypothetical protein
MLKSVASADVKKAPSAFSAPPAAFADPVERAFKASEFLLQAFSQTAAVIEKVINIHFILFLVSSLAPGRAGNGFVLPDQRLDSVPFC